MSKNGFFYLVHFVPENKNNMKYFVCVKLKGDEMISLNYFHGIGYFYNGKISESRDEILKTENVVEREVWIPYNRIDHVESLIYKPR